MTGVTFSYMPDLYDSPAVIVENLPRITKRSSATITLWWLVIFLVKLAFLLFFRRLIVRLPKLYMWWWWALAITILGGLGATVAEGADWLTCRTADVEQLACR